jgi:hypothetical protein
LYSTENEGKAVMCERLNRTLKQMMWKRFSINGNQQWIKILPSIVDQYNNKIHSSIKITPKQAYDNPDKIKEINSKTNFENERILSKQKPKFNVNDKVRIFKWKSLFEKGYSAKWTNEVFVVDKILYTSPITYELKDLNNESIQGKFYSNELQKSDF